MNRRWATISAEVTRCARPVSPREKQGMPARARICGAEEFWLQRRRPHNQFTVHMPRPFIILPIGGLSLALMAPVCGRAQALPAFAGPDTTARADALLARMSLEEKAGQLNQLSAATRSEEHTSELQSL